MLTASTQRNRPPSVIGTHMAQPSRSIHGPSDIVFNYSTVDIAKLRGVIIQVELPGIDPADLPFRRKRAADQRPFLRWSCREFRSDSVPFVTCGSFSGLDGVKSQLTRAGACRMSNQKKIDFTSLCFDVPQR